MIMNSTKLHAQIVDNHQPIGGIAQNWGVKMAGLIATMKTPDGMMRMTPKCVPNAGAQV
jgi:hypothetical protein